MFQITSRRHVGRPAVPCALLLLAAGCAPDASRTVSAGAAPDEGPEPVAVTLFTDRVELFMEFPRLVPGLEARFLAHVTVLATGEPVRSGRLWLELSASGGSTIVFEAPEPARDGLFVPVGALELPGRYDARIVVESDQVHETIVLEPIVVYADLAAARAAADADAGEEPRDVVPFLLEQQWKIGLLMERAERRSLVRRLRVPGEVEAPRDAQAVVGAPLPGRLAPPDAGALPRLGERVEKGQVLAFIEPPLTTSDTAQLAANELVHDTLAMELLLREFDLREKLLEVERTLRTSEADLELARRSLARIEGLRGKDLGTEAELEAARRDVEVALRRSEAARALAGSFAEAEVRLRELREESAAVRAAARPGSSSRHALVAPFAGEVVAVERVEGEHVDVREALFRLIDPSRVWIAARVSEFDLALLGQSPPALVELAAFPERTFDVLGTPGGRIVHVGHVVDPVSRTVTVRYETPDPDGLFRVGMLADVLLETVRSVDAVAIPADAVVMDGGRSVAFVLLDGETFQKRELELGIRDGRFVEVLAGIRAGERVVTRGAYLVKLAAASPASFGEGHAH